MGTSCVPGPLGVATSERLVLEVTGPGLLAASSQSQDTGLGLVGGNPERENLNGRG